jgi:hypothetical protein
VQKTNQPKLWKSNQNQRDAEQEQEQSRKKTRIELCKRTWNISQKHIRKLHNYKMDQPKLEKSKREKWRRRRRRCCCSEQEEGRKKKKKKKKIIVSGLVLMSYKIACGPGKQQQNGGT